MSRSVKLKRITQVGKRRILSLSRGRSAAGDRVYSRGGVPWADGGYPQFGKQNGRQMQANAMETDVQTDTDIGREVFLKLHRLAERLAKRHGISVERAADYLLTGSVFVSAHIQEMSVDDTVDLAATLVESAQTDELSPRAIH